MSSSDWDWIQNHLKLRSACIWKPFPEQFGFNPIFLGGGWKFTLTLQQAKITLKLHVLYTTPHNYNNQIYPIEKLWKKKWKADVILTRHSQICNIYVFRNEAFRLFFIMLFASRWNFLPEIVFQMKEMGKEVTLSKRMELFSVWKNKKEINFSQCKPFYCLLLIFERAIWKKG